MIYNRDLFSEDLKRCCKSKVNSRELFPVEVCKFCLQNDFSNIVE